MRYKALTPAVSVVSLQSNETKFHSSFEPDGHAAVSLQTASAERQKYKSPVTTAPRFGYSLPPLRNPLASKPQLIPESPTLLALAESPWQKEQNYQTSIVTNSLTKH